MLLEGTRLNHKEIREEIIKRSEEKGREASTRAYVKFKVAFDKGRRSTRAGFICLVARRNEDIVRSRNDGNEPLPIETIASIEFSEIVLKSAA